MFNTRPAHVSGLQPYCKDCSDKRNVDLNAVSKLAYGIAGGSKRFYSLPKADRQSIRDAAKKLKLQGMEFAREAERIEQSVKEGFVYVIAHPSWPDYVKIGCALDVESRLGSFQTGCPKRAYRVLHASFTADRRRTEAEVHAALSLYRAEGEWFRVSHAVACSTVSDYSDSATFAQEKA